jgi:hypothetical protein
VRAFLQYVTFTVAVALLVALTPVVARHPSAPLPHADRFEVRVDPAAGRWLTALGPGVHILRAATWDLDRDGDLDVVASTVEEPVATWINDGHGHYIHQHPVRGAGLVSAPTRVEATTDQNPPVAPPTPKWTSAMLPGRFLARSDVSGDDAGPERMARLLAAFVAHRPARAPPVVSCLA